MLTWHLERGSFVSISILSIEGLPIISSSKIFLVHTAGPDWIHFVQKLFLWPRRLIYIEKIPSHVKFPFFSFPVSGFPVFPVFPVFRNPVFPVFSFLFPGFPVSKLLQTFIFQWYFRLFSSTLLWFQYRLSVKSFHFSQNLSYTFLPTFAQPNSPMGFSRHTLWSLASKKFFPIHPHLLLRIQ